MSERELINLYNHAVLTGDTQKMNQCKVLLRNHRKRKANEKRNNTN